MASVPGKFLNSGNIAQKVFDPATDSIRITGSIGGATEVIIDAASGDNIAIKHSDGGDITPSRPLPVSIDNISIAEVEIKNDIGNPVPVNAVDLDIRNLVFATDKVDASGSNVSINNFPVTQDVSGSTVALDSATLAALESTSTVNGALEITQLELLNSKAIDKAYTSLKVDTKNDDGNPTQITIKNGVSTVRTLTISYDADGDFEELVKS